MAASNAYPLSRQSDADENKGLDRLGWLMDDMFRVPVLGWRFGLDALIGLVPVLGDTSTALVSFLILTAAVRQGVPKITILRMALNIGADYLFGLLPIVGDFADAWWKSNRKNLELLKKRAAVSPDEVQAGRASDWIFVGGIIAVLATLAFASAALSLYLFFKLLGY